MSSGRTTSAGTSFVLPTSGNPADEPRPSAPCTPKALSLEDRFEAWIPSPAVLLDEGLALAKVISNWAHGRLDAKRDLPQTNDPRRRAELSWHSLQQTMEVPFREGVFLNGPQEPVLASVWPVSQTLAAALDLLTLHAGGRKEVDAILQSLKLYALDGAFGQGVFHGPPPYHRLVDDNLWLALDFLQAHALTGEPSLLRKAEALYPFFNANRLPSGGLHWGENEQGPSRNGVSNLPAVEYGVLLFKATGKRRYLQLAMECDAFVEQHLRSPSGLIFDRQSDKGEIETRFWTCNQGLSIRADVMLYGVTHAPLYLKRAQATAHAALAYFGQEDRLWREPAPFNAIFFRNLLALDLIAPDPVYKKTLDTYLERAWREARGPTGLFDRGGVGLYSGTEMQLINQAAFVQMFALQCMTPKQLAGLT